MSKKIFVFETENQLSMEDMENFVSNYNELIDESAIIRKYDDIVNAFANEYIDDFIDTVHKNEPEQFNHCFSTIPLSNIKNEISDKVRNGAQFVDEIDSAIAYELTSLNNQLSHYDGVKRFIETYEFKKNTLGESFLVFK